MGRVYHPKERLKYLPEDVSAALAHVRRDVLETKEDSEIVDEEELSDSDTAIVDDTMPDLDNNKESSSSPNNNEDIASKSPSHPAATSSPSPSPPSPAQSPPTMSQRSSESPKLKMKNPHELLAAASVAASVSSAASSLTTAANPMDILKNNPFLLPAQFLALNPGLYAALLAQLQAAQLLLARQQQETLLGGLAATENGEAADFLSSRKRAAEDDIFSAAKYKLSRSSSPPPLTIGKAEKPLDLSGSKFSDDNNGMPMNPYFNPLMPGGLLSFFNQLRPPQSSASQSAATGPTSPRKSPSYSPPTSRSWLSGMTGQWPGNKNAYDSSAKPEDVFKCVWCKESYETLDALTKHMKEAKHHNLGAVFPQSLVTSTANHLGGSSSLPPSSSISASSPSPTKTQVGGAGGRDILRDQMPLPRKLVRGQDVWIGRADEQTRDILKCMGCGQSFRSLDLLTKHMQETQHYKKVISHDQLSNWKYTDGGHGPPGGAANNGHSAAGGGKNHLNSVLACKVCDKGFGTLKDLSDHMVRANHFGPPPSLADNKLSPAAAAMAAAMSRPGAASQFSPQALAAANNSKERKKALPVKKLLELERARQEVAGNYNPVSSREILETGKLLCERCEEKVPIDIFIPHIQQCVGKPRYLKENGTLNVGGGQVSPGLMSSGSSSGKTDLAKSDILGVGDKSGDSSASSILGSLEMLVKGNFSGAGSRPNTTQGQQSPSPRFPAVSSAAAAVGGATRNPQYSPENKFSINSLFPSRTSPLSSASSVASKPPSPIPIKGTILAEKLAEQPLPAANNDHSSHHDRILSPVSSEKSRASPAMSADNKPPKSSTPISSPEPNVANGVDSKEPPSESSENPLAKLQMFCDDQKKAPKTGNGGPSQNGAAGGNSNNANSAAAAANLRKESSASPLSDPGAILAFSWACNQAVAGGGDSTTPIKCPFCDTPFISKGAYRHHLSKMHFTKENLSATSGGPAGASSGAAGTTRTPSPQAAKDTEESLQSKYQKYSQLAKQLSCCEASN